MGPSTCAAPGPTAEASYSYDDATANTYRKGRRWQMTDSSGTQVTWSYDPRGRVTSEARRIEGVTYTTAYTYTSADLLKTMTYPDQEAVTTSYNGAGRVNGVSGWNTYLTGQTYDLQGRPTLTTLGNRARTERQYDALSQRLATLRREVRAPVTYTAYDEARLSYSYDWFGNVTTLADGVTPADNQTFAYDALNRLVGVTGPYAQTYTYDDLGNLLSRGIQTYSYSLAQRHAVSHLGSDPSQRFAYDDMGNLTTRGSQTLVYDAEGRLTRVSSASLGSEDYSYDGDGVLVKRATAAPTTPPAPYSEAFTGYNGGWTYSVSCPGCPIDQQVNQPGGPGHPSILTNPPTKEVYRTASIGDGQGVRVAFGVASNLSGSSIGLETGDWYAGTYHRFGVWQRDGQLMLHLFRNSQPLEQVVLLPQVDINTWYVLELAVDDGAGFRATVWKEGQPGTRYEMRYEMPSGQTWRFHAWSSGSTLSLDDYSEATLGLGSSDARIVGKHYEYDSVSATQTKRYYAAGKLLATRTGTTLTYVQGDHLGSTSTLTNSSGAVVSKERYSAFGERRRTSDKVITDQLHTGQRLNILSNLYHYSDGSSAGRFYDHQQPGLRDVSSCAALDRARIPTPPGVHLWSCRRRDPR